MLRKFGLLLWKNFIIRKRHWFLTICEALLPVLLFLLVAYLRSGMNQMGKEEIDTPTYGQIYNTDEIYWNAYQETLLYTPRTEFTQNLFGKVRERLHTTQQDTIGFATEKELLQYVQENGTEDFSMLAVVFHEDVQKIPEKLSYDIRVYNTIKNWQVKQLYVDNYEYSEDQGAWNYKSSEFLALQLALDVSFVEMATDDKPFPVTLTFQEFPYPPYTTDNGIKAVYNSLLPYITLFSFIFLLPAVIKRVVEEKASGSKELMKTAGLKPWMLWTSWFIHAMFVSLISVAVIVVVMKVKIFDANYPPIEYCSGSVLFVFLVLYVTACISYCFFISSIFSRPMLAVSFGLVIWFVTMPLSTAVIGEYNDMTGLQYVFCLFPGTAMYFGFQIMYQHGIRELSVGWGNLASTISDESIDLSMLGVFGFLLLDSLIFMLLALYIEAVNPGEYGLAKPWHFPISSIRNKFGNRNKKVRRGSAQVYFENEERARSRLIEQPPGNLQTGIKVQNLKKKYGKLTAVDGLSMNIYKDQITVLLGHNGAGKSTTMSMITGMIRATEGKIFVNNQDITRNTSDIQSSLGLCPQHNLLFTDLTVMEHLIFFGVLKGMSFKAARVEADKLLSILNMSEKKDSLARQLSGGMQRKLCLSMALIGNSKVLILDEPTSGMDPESRRFLWDLLLSCRGSRTILITTHLMEEADVLGDWIAIMDHGNLVSYGTPLFLKQRIGTGYNLSVVRDDVYKRVQVDEIIKKYVPAAYTKHENGNTLVYLLPDESKLKFHRLLSDLENEKEALGISAISISVTTLEDVFLKVGRIKEKNGKIETLQTNINIQNAPSSSESQVSTSSLFSKVTGLVCKRWYVFVKKLIIQGPQWLITLAIILLAVIVSHVTSSGSNTKEERIAIDLSIYGSTKVFYGDAGDQNMIAMQDAYENIIKDRGSVPIKTEDVQIAILNQSLMDFAIYRRSLVVAAEFNRTEEELIVNVMYSNLALHGIPISLNLIMNSVLKAFAGDQYSIEAANSPLSSDSVTIPRGWNLSVSIVWLCLVPLGLYFLVGGFLIFPQQERSSEIIQLQYMCGIRAYLYWFSAYIFDLVVYLVVVVIILLVVFLYELAVGAQIFSGANETLALFLIAMSFALPGIPYCYLFSYKASSAGAFTYFVLVSLFVGVILASAIQALTILDHEALGVQLKYAFLLVPPFGISYCVQKFAEQAAKNYESNFVDDSERRCATDACEQHRSYFSGNDLNLTNDLVEMIASTVLYMAIVLFLESTYWQKSREAIVTFYYKTRHPKHQTANDNDERGNYKQLDQKPLMEARDLQKFYGRNKVVSNVSFDVKPGECFCLLGVNGAGKSTTFRMLTGREVATKGTVNVYTESGQVLSLDRDTTEYLRRMGYCPQTNAINNDLTGRQMLQVFAAFRGIPKERVNEEVDVLLGMLDLAEFADKPCGEYSGGNKRKLCFAVALIGKPPLILLDEPTSGVDAAARRKMWELMQNRDARMSIVLTSHSMDECEALGNRLAIMKKGEIYCQDTIPKLKQIYGKGFALILKLKSTPEDEVAGASAMSDELDREIEDLLPATDDPKRVKDVMRHVVRLYKGNISLKDKHLGLLHYHINDPSKKWSEIFREVEDLKRKHPVIEDYSISETSLEEVFLSVASGEDDRQREANTKKRKPSSKGRKI